MRLKDYLKAAGMTRAEFAKMVGCEQPTVSRYLRGRVPAPEVMARIVAATNGAVTPNDFYNLPTEAA